MTEGLTADANTRICLFCKHFMFHSGDKALSDVTPGYDASIYCNKDYWKIDLYWDDDNSYRQKQLTARTCPDFELVNMDELK